MSFSPNKIIAQELGVRGGQVDAAIRLMDEGATVPFIARYRKEATGSLDDTQLRTLESRLTYLRDLQQRRQSVIEKIEQLGKLDPQLLQQLEQATSKTELESLYAPYKSKRRTKGQQAIEAGLEPFALQLLADRPHSPEALAKRHCREGYGDAAAVLDGCQAILAERFAADPAVVSQLRSALTQGWLCSKAGRGKANDNSKFRDYYQHQERYQRTPSHRALAMLRGRAEGELSLSLRIEAEAPPRGAVSRAEQLLAQQVGIKQHGHSGDSWLMSTVQHCWKTKLGPSLENELLSALQQQAHQEAIKVFAANMVDLLMAAPGGMRTTLAIDPGLRTGCKIAVIDTTGKLVETNTIYPHAPQKQWDKALSQLAALVQRHQVELVAIGNGTASRDTDRLVAELIKQTSSALTKVTVSEAGASVYSASELAAAEFPQLDVSIRGAVSIGRRLQDPLAELVKIDPKAIGVGQYQHDVDQQLLAQSLNAVVEDCVNKVGVNVNTASAPLLTRVSGLTPTLAANIVSYREENGRFSSRNQLKKVPRLGPKAFEQCAGFLRISNANNPLDGSSVHPEAYPVVEQISVKTGLTLAQLIGHPTLKQLSPEEFITPQFGLPTVVDILAELDKPGRDPRGEFTNARFKEGVESLTDLEVGMKLEGVITNVTHFGAFVDIGVKQDGLVHISALADRYVEDPRTVVKTGQIVTVTVTEVDIGRKRIALTMRKQPSAHLSSAPTPKRVAKQQGNKTAKGGIMADAFNRAKRR